MKFASLEMIFDVAMPLGAGADAMVLGLEAVGMLGRWAGALPAARSAARSMASACSTTSELVTGTTTRRPHGS